MSQASQIATVDAADIVENMLERDRVRVLTKLLALQATNPAEVGFPHMLPMEIAMGINTLANICKAYGIDKATMTRISNTPLFIKAYQEAVETLKVEGASFKVKARMQAEDFLSTSYQMVKDGNTTDAVRAKLIEMTARWGGLDQKAVETGAGGGNMFAIHINLT